MAPPDAEPIDPDDVLRRTFTSVRRGLDPLEVQKYLLALANELRAGRERQRDLAGRLDEAERKVAELTELAPSRLSSLVGEETARILDAANAAATDIRTRSEENVARLLREAQDEASQARRQAEDLLAARRQEADELVAEARRQVDELVQGARAEGEAAAEAGRQRGREMVVEAQRVRERMLRDLARRRKLLRQQIEQLQAGRERLVAAYDVVRQTLDVATEELQVVVPEAKLAAEAAALRAEEAGEVEGPPLEEEIAALVVEVEAADVAAGAADGGADVEAGAGADAAGEVEEVEGVEVDEGPGEGPGPGDVGAGPGAEADGVPAGDLPRAADPVEGRRSTAVNVVRAADIFARIKEDAADTEGEAGPAAAAGADDEGDDDGGEGGDGDGEPAPGVVGARDRATGELARRLARTVKRELSDEQNELLDAVRRGGPGADDLLPAPEAHVERLAAAMGPALVEAAEAGAALVGEEPSTTAAQVRDLAADLAAELVAPLRDRLQRCLDETDPDALADRVRACYREWRTQRVDALADQAVLSAFNRGVVDAVEPGTLVRWVVDDGGAASPDCEDNALAGEIPVGDAFPTGHEVPPAHPACRCVVVPSAVVAAFDT